MLEAVEELKKISQFLGSIAKDLGYLADKQRKADGVLPTPAPPTTPAVQPTGGNQ